MRRALWVYRRLLKLYPAAYRRDYEAQLIQLFGDLYREHAGSSLVQRGRFWLWMVADTLKGAAYARYRALIEAPPSSFTTFILVIFLLLMGFNLLIQVGGVFTIGSARQVQAEPPPRGVSLFFGLVYQLGFIALFRVIARHLSRLAKIGYALLLLVGFFLLFTTLHPELRNAIFTTEATFVGAALMGLQNAGYLLFGLTALRAKWNAIAAGQLLVGTSVLLRIILALIGVTAMPIPLNLVPSALLYLGLLILTYEALQERDQSLSTTTSNYRF